MATSAFAQVKINEVMATGVGTDSKEFIELYGAGNLDLSPYKVELVNGSNGAVYQSHDLQGKAIPADGYFVMAGGTLVPNTDFTTGTATNWIQNGDPDAIVIRRKSDNAVIDAVSYYTQYDTVPGTPEYVSLASSAYEGSGAGVGGDDSFNVQTGTAASAAQNENTFGRFPDGADSDNNFNDFVMLHGGQSPGASNASTYNLTLPFSETMSTGGLTRKWGRFFTDIVLETAGTTSTLPTPIPNSPDSVSPDMFASMKDNTGGGDENAIVDFLGKDYYVEGLFYCGQISVTTDGLELGSLMGRRTVWQNNITGNSYPITTPAGTYGDCFYAMEASYTSGTIEAIKVEKSVRTVLFTSSVVSTGWHKLALNMNGGVVEFKLDGTTIYTLTGETPRYGIVSVGYRETSVATVGTVRNNFDAIKVQASTIPAKVNDWGIY